MRTVQSGSLQFAAERNGKVLSLLLAGGQKSEILIFLLVHPSQPLVKPLV